MCGCDCGAMDGDGGFGGVMFFLPSMAIMRGVLRLRGLYSRTGTERWVR